MTDTPSSNAIKLFHKAYKNVPAYKKFIDQHNIDSKKIKSIKDFEKIPFTDKHNYINKYPLNERIYKDKQLSDYYMICSSSGTSGKPTFWPRDFATDKNLEKLKEQMFEEHFGISKKRTLCLITFGLGTWTAGMLSTKLSLPAAKNNQFSVITPGLDKENTMTLIKALYTEYDQIILLGYPPFLTDLIELIKMKSKNIKRFNLKLFYTSERVSEHWRNTMASLLTTKNQRHDMVGFYACSDTGIIGAETKTIIDLLQKANEKPELSNSLFGSEDTPTLASYNPFKKYLESVNNEILITADQPIPLIRYNIHDRGRLLHKKTVIQNITKHFPNFSTQSIPEHLVYIFGRSDAVKITANVYIEDIQYCLENSSFTKRLSGHFKYGTEKTNGNKYRLKIIIYQKKNTNLTIKDKNIFEREFYKNLLEANNDFKMIQSGTKIEPFHFIYQTEELDKYQTSKLQHFL